MGWTVFAVDVTDAAKQLIEDRINAEQKDRLQIEIGSFETIELPPADLVYAQMSLPFAGDKFEQAVDNALAAVKKGGVFAGQFFGERDEWAGDPGTAAVPKEWVNERFRSFDRVEIDETDEEGPFGLEGLTKHWHYYYVLATR